VSRPGERPSGRGNRDSVHGRIASPHMAKTSAVIPATIVKDIRSALDELEVEKPRGGSAARSGVKVLGLKLASVRGVARDVANRHRAVLDLEVAVAVVDAAVARKVREEILVALELLDRFRKDLPVSLFSSLERWIAVGDDLEVAEALGSRVASPLLGLDPAKMATVKKWARTRSAGRRRLAVLATAALVSEGRRDVPAVLEVCEILLNEEHPLLVAEVAGLLRSSTKVDAKAVQDFLFRRSIDGNPEILRAGSENLDAARRAALIAKLEAQAGIVPVTAAAGR